MENKKVIVQLSKKQNEALLCLRDKTTEVLLYGGQANSGKSWLGAYYLMTSCLMYKNSRYALCRKTLKEIKNTSLKTFNDCCKFYGVKKNVHYKINLQNNTINFINGSEILLIGLEWQPSDMDADFLGGIELTGAVIEELPQIRKDYFEVLYSRIRYKLDEFKITKKVLCTCNPTNNWVKTYFYDRFIKNTLPNEIKFITTIGEINPFRDLNYTKTLSLLSAQKLKRLEYGDWEYASSSDDLFGHQKFEEIFTGLNFGNNLYYVTADIARMGEDNTVIIVWQGLTIIEIHKLSKVDTSETTKFIYEIMQRLKISRDKVIVDSVGIGAGVRDNLKCIEFIGNAKALKNEKYDMLKTQMFFNLSKTVWSIKNNIKEEYKEEIRKELSAIKDCSDDYKYRINSKDEQKRLLNNKSPDFADAISLRMYFEISYTKADVNFI